VQAPIDMAAPGTDWYTTVSKFAFLPIYKPFNATGAGPYNYVYTVNGTFGTLYAAEGQTIMNKQVEWSSSQLRFHYPAEHKV